MLHTGCRKEDVSSAYLIKWCTASEWHEDCEDGWVWTAWNPKTVATLHELGPETVKWSSNWWGITCTLNRRWFVRWVLMVWERGRYVWRFATPSHGWAYSAMTMKCFLANCSFVEISHPHYSTDLVPYGLFLFSKLKTALKGISFWYSEHQDFRVTRSTHKGSHIALCSVNIEELNTCTVQTDNRKSIINGHVAEPKLIFRRSHSWARKIPS